jgi:putative peptidoglycan lipid II flippase
MAGKQISNTLMLFFGQFLIKGSGLIKQIVMAFFLGVSSQLDLLLVSQIVPSIIASMIAGGAGEVIVTQQKKGRNYDDQLVVVFVFCITILTLLVGLIYLGFIPFFAKILDVNESQLIVFWTISILIMFSKIPSSVVSSLQHLLYAKEKYKYFIFSTIISEIAGIFTIFILVPNYGIIAFAYGLIVTPVINAIFFWNSQNLNPKLIFSKKVWIEKKNDLKILLSRTLSLSLQTLLNHSSTFWERTLSFSYLQPGFLSAMNYSKNLTQLPKLALLSSVLTTTYIEQLNKKTESEDAYIKYSNKMEVLLSEIAFVFQLLAMIFGPLVLILIFRRGAFDNEAVKTTFGIYQILTVGFFPGLMLSFLSRTMYLEKEYRKLMIVNIIKFILELVVMFSFIQISGYAIPIAFVIGNFFVSITLFFFLVKKKPNILNLKKFILVNLLLVILSLTILVINQFVITNLLNFNLLNLIVIYLPVMIISILSIIYYIKKRFPSEIKNFLKRKFFTKSITYN